ncbi:HNH endonuclease [[Bacillus] sp. KCTC 13219]|nr:HNH endonuclease [[Bacillus] sp. KCTC 13219]
MHITKDRKQQLVQYIADGELMKFYKSREWRALRKKAIERDNAECQHCKELGRVTTRNTINERGKRTKMDVNHIKPVKTHPHLALTLGNLEYLCVDCHNKADGKDEMIKQYGQKNKFTNDERW